MQVLPINMLNDPLAKTLPIAFLLHALLIFGVSFAPQRDPQAHLAPILDITLVQTHTEKAPDVVDFLAQANQEASGTSEEKNRPQSPLSSLIPTDMEDGDAPMQSQAASADNPLKITPQVLTTKGETFKPVEKAPEQPDETQDPIAERSDTDQQVAQLLAEMNDDEARYARRPRIHFIDAVSAKSAVEAEYIDAWVKKIERIGNINFPEEAIAQNLSGKLILNVTLDQVGRVVDSQISVSSGSDVLDKAALRIIQLAAPYPQLPDEISRKWDQLNITRTWIFHSGTLNTQ